MTLKKANLIKTIRNNLNLTRDQSTQLVDSAIEIIKRTLESGEDVMISSFGKFCVKDKSKRRGRNPETGKDLMIKGRRVVTFSCSGRLRKKINGD